jgi:hypothetical protein
MLNLSCRNYQLTIDGLICTPALSEIEGNYDHYQSGTGYIKISASLTLRRPIIDWSESLDHRTNNRWARGKEISFQINDKDLNLTHCPLLGKLYILNANYDGINTLKIDAGCILSLLDFRSPSGDGICIDPGNNTSLNSVAQILLSKAGVPDYEIDIDGYSLSEPLPKLSNESFIQLLGKICYANNYIFYQDRFGVIKFKRAKTSDVPSLKDMVVGEHELKYDPLNGNEKPSEIYKVSGTKKKTITIEQTETITENEGTYADPESETIYNGIIERITEEIDEISGRQVISRTKVERIAGLCSGRFQGDLSLIIAERITLTKFFESKSYATECSDTDNGGLLRSEEIILSPYGMLFEQFINKVEELAEANNEKIIILGERSLFTARKTTVTYKYEVDDKEYDILEESSGSYKLGKASKTTITLQPKGIMGIWEAMTEADEFDRWKVFSPSSLVTGEKIEETWTELSPNEWEYIMDRSQAAYLAYPSETVAYMNTLRAKDVTKLSYDFFWDLKTVEHKKSRSFTANQPPGEEYFPNQKQTIETQIIEIEEFKTYTSDYQPKIKEITIDAGMLTSNEQAREVARLDAEIIWGKYRGNSCTTALFDEFLSISPLDGCSWLEKTGYKHSFLIDGFSIAFTDRQLAVSFDGIWTGQNQTIISNGIETYLLTGNETVETIGNDIIITVEGEYPIIISNGVESEILIPVLEVMGLPQKYSLSSKSTDKGHFNYLWYDVNTITQYSFSGNHEDIGYFEFLIIGSTFCGINLSPLRTINVDFCDIDVSALQTDS